MNRRRLLMLLAGTAAMWHRAGHAQQIPRLPRVGVLHQTSSTEAKQAASEFRKGMRALGWIDGSTVAIEDHFANGDASLLASNAAGLVAAKVDVIVAFSGVPARAAREATSAIPIVMDVGDAVGSGLVASLAHPGGNVTGQSLMRPDMAAKQRNCFAKWCPNSARSVCSCSRTTRFINSKWRSSNARPPNWASRC